MNVKELQYLAGNMSKGEYQESLNEVTVAEMLELLEPVVVVLVSFVFSVAVRNKIDRTTFQAFLGQNATEEDLEKAYEILKDGESKQSVVFLKQKIADIKEVHAKGLAPIFKKIKEKNWKEVGQLYRAEYRSFNLKFLAGNKASVAIIDEILKQEKDLIKPGSKSYKALVGVFGNQTANNLYKSSQRAMNKFISIYKKKKKVDNDIMRG